MDELTITSKLNGKGSNHQTKPTKPQKNNLQESFSHSLDKLTLKSTGPKKDLDKQKPAEVRQDLVKKYKLDLKKGNYNIKSLEIADKIVQNIRDKRSKFQL